MSELTIERWTGRLGNTVLQLLRSIHFARERGYTSIRYPTHALVDGDVLNLDTAHQGQPPPLRGLFFDLDALGLQDPPLAQMKRDYQQYLAPIVRSERLRQVTPGDAADLHIHIRSGDLFVTPQTPRPPGKPYVPPHSKYVQPPLSYYVDAIQAENWRRVQVVYEDDANPCVGALRGLADTRISFQSSDLGSDLMELSTARNLMVGYGTFGLLVYFMCLGLQRLYLPDYFGETLPAGDWGEVDVRVIAMPGYIASGAWRNTPEQRRLMLSFGSVG